MLYPNPLLLRGKLEAVSSLPILCCYARVGFMARVCFSISYPFWYGCFLVRTMCRSHSASFWISFWENCSVCSCIFGVSMGGGEFRSILWSFLLAPGNFYKFYVLVMLSSEILVVNICCSCYVVICPQYCIPYLKVAKRIDLKISHHKKKNFVTMYCNGY